MGSGRLSEGILAQSKAGGSIPCWAASARAYGEAGLAGRAAEGKQEMAEGQTQKQWAEGGQRAQAASLG